MLRIADRDDLAQPAFTETEVHARDRGLGGIALAPPLLAEVVRDLDLGPCALHEEETGVANELPRVLELDRPETETMLPLVREEPLDGAARSFERRRGATRDEAHHVWVAEHALVQRARVERRERTDDQATCLDRQRHGGNITQNPSVAEVRAFPGLRYDDHVAGPLSDLICPPYDVISDDDRRRLLARNERNFVRIELPDPKPEGYAAAARYLREWRAGGVLRTDPPSLYLHEHDFTLGGARATRRGVFVALRLYGAGENVVLPHERTFPKAKADRLDLLRATRTNTSPIFGMIAGAAMRPLDGARSTPAGDARLGDDAHRLRRLDDPAALGAFVEAMRGERVYIADGHHRYETALTYANERRAPEGSPERFVLSYLCALDDPGLRILGTHRVVTGGRAALDTAVALSFTATEIDPTTMERERPGIVIARDDVLMRLEPRADADRTALPSAWRDLPVAIAEELLLRQARDAGAEIAYEHDTGRAIARARGGSVAVLVRAVEPHTLRAVADAGERLPQKTTYFYPKVPTALVVRSLDAA